MSDALGPDSLERLLRDAADAATRCDPLAPVAAILAEWEAAQHKGQVVAVVGEVKKGKSSLINALAGVADLSPVSSDVATSVALRLRHGPPRVEVEFYPPPGEAAPPIQAIARAEVAGFATEDGNPANRLQVDAINVYAESPFLAAGVTLLDTPGLGGLFRNHAAVTWRHVPTADAVLFVTDSVETVLTQDEIDYIKQLARLGKYILFVQTKTDAADAEQVLGWKKRNLDILAEATGKPANTIAYFCVSARLAAKAETSTPELREKLLKRSGIDDVRRFLVDRLGGSRRKQAQARCAAELKGLLAAAGKAAQERAVQANAAATGELAQVEAQFVERRKALTEWLQNEHRQTARNFAQMVADTQRAAVREAKAALQTTASAELYRSIESEVTAMLANPSAGLQSRVDGVVEKCREGCAAVAVDIGMGLRTCGLEMLTALSQGLLGGEREVQLDVEVEAAADNVLAGAGQIEVEEPKASRAEHVLTSMTLAMSVGGAASALFPPVGLITGVAVLWWMSSRKQAEAQAKELAQLRAKLIPSLQAEFRSALAATLQLVEDLTTQIKRTGDELVEASATKKRNELAELQEWLVAQRTKGKEDQKAAVEAAKATSAVVQTLAGRLQKLTDKPIPAG